MYSINDIKRYVETIINRRVYVYQYTHEKQRLIITSGLDYEASE